MKYIRDKVILLMLFIVLIYFIYRSSHFDSGNILYDHILIFYIVFCVWYICFNYRSFVLTRRMLSKYKYDLPLEYKYSELDKKVKLVYVRVFGESDWYKLDNILTISLPCNIVELNIFMRNNSSVYRLLSTMNKNARGNNKYFLMKSDYNILRVVILLFMLLIFFIYCLVYNKLN